MVSLIHEAEPLSEADLAEREELLKQGLDNWSKREFSAFIKAQEKHGRYNLDIIAAEVEGKTLEEVKFYSEIFWQRYKEIADHEKIIANIERAEAKLQRIIETNNAIDQKIAMYRAPLQQIKFIYGQNKGKAYSEEEDRFLVLSLNIVGNASEVPLRIG
jgi:SWI/SNF-related matrix-associated actin-dependent regulator of chromatin subfamily A member 5